MVISHILPIDLLGLIEKRPFYMCLAHLAYKNDKYLDFYKKQSELGKFVLLDNGAYEGEQLTKEQMFEVVQKIKPSEIILNDCLFDGPETIKLSKDSLKYYKSNGYTGKYMFVPQGNTFEEWKQCHNYMSLVDVSTIGIAKHINKTFNNDDARYECCDWLKETIFKIHLLGCQTNINEVYKIGKQFNNVRSCDTALAYIYSMDDKVCWYCDRPDCKIDFYNNELSEAQTELLNWNISLIDNLVNSI